MTNYCFLDSTEQYFTIIVDARNFMAIIDTSTGDLAANLVLGDSCNNINIYHLDTNWTQDLRQIYSVSVISL